MDALKLRVLAVEPYYGGSHRAVLDGLAARLGPLGVTFDFLTLPARKWKWRMRLFPDHRPAGIPGRVAASAEVLSPPFDAALIDSAPFTRGRRPRIVWPHRWEHDKDPGTFLRAAHALAEEGLDFEVAIAGQPHRDTRAAIEGAADRLGDRIVHPGPPESPEAYAGWLPIVPDRLAYPEVYPAECRYGSFNALVSQLRSSVIGRPAA